MVWYGLGCLAHGSLNFVRKRGTKWPKKSDLGIKNVLVEVEEDFFADAAVRGPACSSDVLNLPLSFGVENPNPSEFWADFGISSPGLYRTG
jgi:hypothetical protein